MEFPRLVFKNGGPHQRPGGFYDHTPVENEAEYEAALKAGWFGTMPEALAPPPVAALPPADDAPPTRAELEAKAKELHIEFSPKIGDAKLAERIQAALDAHPEA